MPHADINSPDRRVRWRARNPEKDRAHRIVEQAIKTGKLVRQPCYVKKCPNKAHAHHHDYKKPLEIDKWACAVHHIVDHWREQWREQRTIEGRSANVMVIRETTVIEEEADENGRQPITDTLVERQPVTREWDDQKFVSTAQGKGGVTYVGRVGLKRGKAHVGIREFFEADDGSIRPTANGIDVPATVAGEVADALKAAADAAYADRELIEAKREASIQKMLDRQAARAATAGG